MPKESIATIMEMISCCRRLVDSVEEEDKMATIGTLKECAMLNIKLLRLIPGLDLLGADQIVAKGDEREFKKKLTKLLA